MSMMPKTPFRVHMERAKAAVDEMWGRRYDTDTGQIPDVKDGPIFGCPVAVDMGQLAVARSELVAAAYWLKRKGKPLPKTSWIHGPPTEPGDYHLLVDDSTGYPITVVGHVAKRWKDLPDPPTPTELLVMSDAEIENLMELCFLIPQLSETNPAWKPIGELSCCQAHRTLPLPEEK